MTADCIDHGQGAARYGYTSVGGRSCLLHRKVYADAHGLDVFTMGGVVRHSCDNPRCINPDHLSLGTQSDNIQDAVRRGRHNPARGERSGSAKLTAADVRFIRESTLKQQELANMFGVRQGTISRIKGGSRWAHLTK